MKLSTLSRAFIIATLTLASHSQDAAAPTAPVTPSAPALSPDAIKKISSYGFGIQNGRQFGQAMSRYGINSDDINHDEFLKGFVAGMANKPLDVKEADIQQAMQGLQAAVELREKKIAETNLAAGKQFLEKNGKRKEVITSASGLQYEILAKGGDKKFVPGASEEADTGKQFLVNYRGTTIEGKEFDKSPEGQPVPMTLQVVPGFKEAITTMPIGAKWKLFIPSALAYGETRRSAEIAPNSVLIFELELIDIKDAPKQPQGGFPMPELPQGE